jgi:transcriptional regulator with XRE-family HTH domain
LTDNSTRGTVEGVGKQRGVTLGSRIRELRLRAKLSQRALAESVSRRLREGDRRGFDFTYLSKIENDHLPHAPSAAAIIAISAELAAELALNAKELSDELLALAGKVSPDVGEMLKRSEGARMFFRSALSTGLPEDEWRQLLERIRRKESK